jgi:cellulase/cellobiase CelA1
MTWRSRLLSLLVAFVLSALASAGALPATTPASSASAFDTTGDCQVSYQLAAQWTGGFYSLVTLTNLGAPTSSGWEVTLDFPDGQTVRPPWDPIRIPPQPGEPLNPVRIRNASWNGAIQPSGSITFGLVGTYAVANRPPMTSCVLFF